MAAPRKNPDRKVDKNDPLNYIGLDPRGRPFRFMHWEGYLNNFYVNLKKQPAKWPYDTDWKEVKGPSYHKETWVPPDKDSEDSYARRRLERDPNHPMWEPAKSLLRWWHIRINLLGSDMQGRQMIAIRIGKGEPIHIRVGQRFEVYYKGKRVKLEEDENGGTDTLGG